MKVNYLIVEGHTGEVVETGICRVDLARARAGEALLFVMHDGSLSEVTNIPPAAVADPNLLYGMTEAGLVGAPILETTAPEVSVTDAAQQYLESTDWYVVRQLETGTPIPADVTEKRAEARLIVSSPQHGDEA